MRTVPTALQANLDAGATTLCRCWVLTRRDGAVLGFTDHDRDLVFAGVTCRADSGFAGAEITARLGLSVDGSEIGGALAAETLNEADLAAGLFDAAQIAIHLVDWSEPTLAVQLAQGVIGEVRREEGAFTAEVRSLAHRLDEESGRLFTANCTADLGDARCRVDLDQPEWRGSGVVASSQGASALLASGLDGYAPGLFAGGKLTWTGGANEGIAAEVKTHSVVEGAVRLGLWHAAPEPIAAGDTFDVRAGCDKRVATCRDRFANLVNFRGFPHIPGNDFVVRYPKPGEPGHRGDPLPM